MRTTYRAGYRLARLWWRLRRPEHQGALVAIWVEGRLLLLRQSYQPRAAFPGGGVHPGEDPADAVRREVREELGLTLPPAELRPVCRTRQLWDNRHDTVTFFECHLAAEPDLRIDRREVVGAAFVAEADLPASVSPPVGYYLAWRAGHSTSGAQGL